MSSAGPAPAAWQPDDGLSGRFEGRAAFDAQLQYFLQQAAAQGWRQIIVADADFADWAWGSADAVELLHHWARQGGQMTVLAHRFDRLVQRHPRWVQWRKTWDHRLQCRRLLSRDVAQVPSALWSPQWAVQRLDVDRCVGVASAERSAIVPLGERLQEWIRSASTPDFAATVLGL
ncbi:MAG: hypothetical protein LBE58_04740 [Comamonas sp.]|jgi:hypothetical protein|nr:hypothetical protein [Comamonas sp.]